LPVIPYHGYLVPLFATGNALDFAPSEDTIGSIRVADTDTQKAVAESFAANHNRLELLGLAQAIITQAMRSE
jgi:hypothetical protein